MSRLGYISQARLNSLDWTGIGVCSIPIKNGQYAELVPHHKMFLAVETIEAGDFIEVAQPESEHEGFVRVTRYVEEHLPEASEEEQETWRSNVDYQDLW